MDEQEVMLLEEEEDTQKEKYLLFCLDDDLYGIGVSYVTEIVGLHPITPIPELPEYIKGIMNLRGKIIPVMDPRRKFGKEEKYVTDRTCMVVVEVEDITVSLMVDLVMEVAMIPEEETQPPPGLNTGSRKYIQSIGKAGNLMIMLLDCRKLLEESNEMLLQK